MATSTDDPLLAAWYDAMGFRQESAQTQATNAIGRAQSVHDLDVPRIEQLGQRAQGDIVSTMEGRGAYRSGETLRRLAEQSQDQAYATGKADLQLANQKGTIEDQLAAELVSLRAQNAQREAEAKARAQSGSSDSGTFG